MLNKAVFKLSQVTSQDSMTFIRIAFLLAALITALLMPEIAGAGPGDGCN